MNVFPVVTRELRAQAQQPFTYWLRMLGVAALLVGGLLFTVNNPVTPSRGATLFGLMHLTLLATVWILVPLGAADCLSRERREGTLGLLFLTPLKSRDIVLAKGLSHGLRGTTLLVAVLPALTIPFLLGGITWQQAVGSALINLTALCWALGAALVASAFNRSGVRAMGMAVLLAALALLASTYVTGVLVSSNLMAAVRSGYAARDFNFLVGFAVTGFHPQSWGLWSSAAAGISAAQLLTGLLQSAVISLFGLIAAVWFAAMRVRRSWQEEPPSARVQQMERVFLQPIIGVAFLKRWMRWKLERNPIGWLEQRSWNGRLVTWTWFAIIISVQTTALTDRGFFRSYSTWENLMAWLLTFSMAASAAGSFRRERETGVLELLLVSPLTTWQIIGGRLRGLWGQFLPSIVTLLGIWIHFAGLFEPGDSLRQVWLFLVTFAVLPVIGLYFSVSCRHFIAAYVLTLGTVLVLPILVIAGMRAVRWIYVGTFDYGWNLADISGEIWSFQLIFAGLFSALLYRRLETRSFPLERGVA
jgi:ABC-type transport system involved in multi-copper enzyme maturation permease subunit